jgi:hypothetical protein
MQHTPNYARIHEALDGYTDVAVARVDQLCNLTAGHRYLLPHGCGVVSRTHYGDIHLIHALLHLSGGCTRQRFMFLDRYLYSSTGYFRPPLHQHSLHLTVILPDASVSKRVKESLVVIVDVAAACIWWKEVSPPQLVTMMVLEGNAAAQ